MWIFPFTFMILCLVFLFLFLFRGPRWFFGHWDHHGSRETARDILDRRYASGELTKEQYRSVSI
jgi:putative membrane protein